MKLDRLCVRIHAEGPGPGTDSVIRTFHGWIEGKVTGELLVDIHDYTHVPDGPGVLLAGVDGNYSLGPAGEGTVLTYQRKRATTDDPGTLLRDALRKALTACRLLEEDDGLGLRFRGGEVDVIVNDRLAAPNEEATLDAFRPLLEPVLADLFGGAPYDLDRDPDPGERFAVAVRSRGPLDVATAAARLG